MRTTSAQRDGFTRRLLAWYARTARDLPWRRTRDPYRVLVSEFMLQQTQVSRVREYYPHLHALARVVSQDLDGTLPEDPQALLKLPGVGPYTAGAVASFAYEKPVPAVDTNVARVIRRVFFERATGKVQRVTEVWRLAGRLVPKNGKRAWRFNQAVMELGALICVARKPRCPQCPVRPVCRTGKS